MRKHPSEVFEGEREGGLFSKSPPSQTHKETAGEEGCFFGESNVSLHLPYEPSRANHGGVAARRAGTGRA